ncbi:MAG: aminopeptidase P family protein [Proteobacteria bacterium]|nr:aminopeptidase P family protein [Pseudomonadota bacterium]
MRRFRLARLQAELKRRDHAAAVLYDPINIRYATGSRNMAVWTLHNAARYLFVPAEGKTVLFDFHGCGHLSDGLETIGEVRPARSWFYFASGSRTEEKAGTWAKEMVELFGERLGGSRRIAFDHIDPAGLRALERLGCEILDAQEPCEQARAVKSPDEINCMLHAIAVCEAGMARMREELKPGISEQELWSSLNDTNHRLGGEWIECRLLSSGGRTNPWFKEASEKIIRPGDIVSFDTDLIGPFGYCADLSRTYLCGPSRASEEQKRLYGLALEQIHFNIDLVKPGLSLKEFSEKAWRIPNAYAANRYSCVAHGVGLCDEWPKVAHAADFARSGYDGVLEPNMTICIESYMGAEGGAEGVKLEQQVLVTETGAEVMTVFPFEERLMG